MTESLSANSQSITKKTFRQFFLPALLTSLGLALAGTVDSVVVGTVLGENGLATVAFAAPIYMLFDMCSLGFAIGGSIFFTQLLGGGDAKKASAVFRSCFWFMLCVSILVAIVGNIFLEQLLVLLGCPPSNSAVYPLLHEYGSILFTFAPFLMMRYVLYFFSRADNAPRLSAIGFFAGNFTDFGLNILFVIGLGFGVRGAATASVIGAVCSCIICSTPLLRKQSLLKLRKPRIQFSLLGKSFLTGFGTSSTFLASFLVMMVLLNLVSRLGGTVGVAAFDVMFNVMLVMTSLFEATHTTMQPMISTYHAERNIPLIRSTVRLTFQWGSIVTILAVFSAGLFMSQVCMFFGLKSADSIQVGIQSLTALLPAVVLMFVNSTFANFYQSIEKIRLLYFITIARTFAFLLLFAFTLSALGGIAWLWYCYLASEVLTLLILVCIWIKKRSVLLLDYANSDKILLLDVHQQNWCLPDILSQTEAFCEANNASPTQNYYVALTLEEICSIIFGQVQTDNSQTYISIVLIANQGGDFTLHLRDNSNTFNPFDVHAAKYCAQSEDEVLDGLGVYMVQQKAKSCFYHRYQGFNKLVIVI